MLGNLRISYKLLMIVGLSVLAIAAVAGLGLSALWNNLMEDRRGKLQDIVTVAREALDHNYQDSLKAGLSEADAMERAKALLRTLRFSKDDYIYANNQQGIAVANPNPKVEGKNMLDVADPDGVFFVRRQLELAVQGGGFLSFRFPRAAGGDPIPKLTYAVQFKPFNWIVGAGIYLDDVSAIFWAQARSMAMMVVLALLVVGGLFFLVGRSIVNPINAMTMAMRKISQGDTSTSIAALERGDEVGAMAQSVKVFKDNMIEATRLRGEQDVMKAQADSERKSLLVRMADEFERGVRASLDSLAGAASNMQATSKSMSSTASEASHQATSVAAVAEQASANVQTVAAATEELSSSDSEIGRQVTQSTEIAGQADQRPVAGVVSRGAENRRRRQADQRHREPDQSAGAQRHHRSGSRRRGGQGLCRRCQRGQIAGEPDGESDRRNIGPGRRHAGSDDGSRTGDRGHRSDDRRHQRYHVGHLACGRAA